MAIHIPQKIDHSPGSSHTGIRYHVMGFQGTSSRRLDKTLTQMFISYWNEILLIDGEALILKRIPIILVPVRHDEYIIIESESELDESTQKVVVDLQLEKITISSAWFGEFNLFYHISDENFVISSSFGEVLEFLRSKNVSTELDKIAVYESLIFDCPIRDRTFCKQIKKTIPGEKIEFELRPVRVKSRSTYIAQYYNGKENQSHDHLLNKATDILSNLISIKDRQKLNEKRVLLPLSGGNDSRLLACLLKKQGVHFDSVTFGPWESSDPFMAKRVASKIGMVITHLNLEDSYYKLYGDEVTVQSNGFSGHAHCHLYSVLAHHQIYNDFMIHSYSAEIARATITDWPDGANISRDQAMSRYLNEHVRNNRSWTLLNWSEQSVIIDDLSKVMVDCCTINSPQYFNDYLNKVDITSTLISSIFNVCESFGTLIRPYACVEYQSFFSSLPTQYRKKRRLFREACRMLFPREFSLGTAEEVFDRSLFLKGMEALLCTVMNIFCYGAFLVSGGRLWIPNPKTFERHRKILSGVLKYDLLNAIEHLRSRLDIDLSKCSKSSYDNRKQISSQYRVISSSAFLRYHNL